MNVAPMPRFGSWFKLTIDPAVVETTQDKTGQYANVLENTMVPFSQDLNTSGSSRFGTVQDQGSFHKITLDQAGCGIMAKNKTVLEFAVLDILDKLLLKHLNAALEKAGLPNRVALEDGQPLAPVTQGNLGIVNSMIDTEYKLP